MTQLRKDFGRRVLLESRLGDFVVLSSELGEGVLHEAWIAEEPVVRREDCSLPPRDTVMREDRIKKGHDAIREKVRDQEVPLTVEAHLLKMDRARATTVDAGYQIEAARLGLARARGEELQAAWGLDRAQDAARRGNKPRNYEPLNKLGIRPETIAEANFPDDWLLLAAGGDDNVWRTAGPPLAEVEKVVVVPSCLEAYAYFQTHEDDLARCLFVVCPVAPEGAHDDRDRNRIHMNYILSEVNGQTRVSPSLAGVEVRYASAAYNVGMDIPAQNRVPSSLAIVEEIPPAYGKPMGSWADVVEKREVNYIRSLGGRREQGVQR